MAIKNPYEILDITETASFEEIRKAYLKKVKLCPPEKDPEGFKVIRKAYSLLKDGEQRKRLDLTLYRRKSGLKLINNEDYNFNSLFKDRIFRLLLYSSDLYVKNFKTHFHDITDEIRKLK